MMETRSEAAVTASDRAGAAGPKSLALFNEEQRHIAPGLQQIALFSKLAMDHGTGAVLVDADGKEYIDFIAGVCVASIGHGHPTFAKAISEQVERVSVGSFTTKNRVEFCRGLMDVTPEGIDRVQLYSSGAEAVEAGLRLAKSYTKGYEFIGFWGGFHGKTGGVLGLLGDTFKHDLGPIMPGTYLAPFPDPYRCPFKTEGEHDCVAHCLDFLRTMIRRSTAHALAGIIVEPIQGTAGNVIPPEGFLAGLRDIAHEHGAVLIADEMITGFGRTGRWFGTDHDGVVADIMTIGKGMAGGFPVSGVLASTEVASAMPFARPSGSSSSYGGNPLAAAACNATLEILKEERLVENSREIGAYLLESLIPMKERFPFIGDVRGRGMLIGVELVRNRETKERLPREACRKIFEGALARGLVTMAYSPVIRINPPLVLTKEQAAQGLAILEETFEDVSGELEPFLS